MTRTIGSLKAASIAAGVVAASLALAPPAMAAGDTGAYNCKVYGGAHLKGGVQAGQNMSLGMERRGNAPRWYFCDTNEATNNFLGCKRTLPDVCDRQWKAI
jgi:hypothetical protein